VKNVVKLFFIFCAFFIGVGILVYISDALKSFTNEAVRRLEVIRQEKYIPNIVTKNTNNLFKALSSISGQVTFMNFFYTGCLNICQSSSVEFKWLRNIIFEKDFPLQFVSVSFDSTVDDLEALKGYSYLHNVTDTIWTLTRIKILDLEYILNFFKIYILPDKVGGYQHNLSILLVNPNGNFIGIFNVFEHKKIIQVLEETFV
jgi:protein SCO1/2